MDDLRPDAVAARVAAWHNRHPLARRITSAQVQAIGFVAMPFVPRPGAVRSDALADLPTLPLSDAALGHPRSVAPAAGGLRARARSHAAPASLSAGEDPPFDNFPGAPRSLPAPPIAAGLLASVRARWAKLSGRSRAAALVRNKARLRAKALKRAFSEPFLPGLSPRQVARWALRHGRLDLGHAAPVALRQVLPDARLLGNASATTTLYLATAAVEVGKRRARVLLGDGPAADAIGNRLLSGPRVAATLVSLALLASLLIGPPLPQVQDLAHWRASTLWLSMSAWVLRYSGNDPALQTAGPRLANVPRAGQPAAAEMAVADPYAVPGDPAAAEAVRIGALAAAASAAPGMADAQSGTVEVAVASDAPGTADAVVRMADVTPAMPSARRAALFPDDPPPQDAAARGGATATAPAGGSIGTVRPALDDAAKSEARKLVAEVRAARGTAPSAPAPALALAHALAPAPANTNASFLSPSAAPSTATVAAPPEPRAPPGGMPRLPLSAPVPATASALATAPAQLAAARVPPSAAVAYALSTRLLRTRSESEQVLIAWRALLGADPRNPLNVSVMPAGEDWRVVCWPFPSRQDADRARGLLAARGLRADTVDF